MSQENVEIVRRGYEAWVSGGPEGLRPFLADDVETHDAAEMPDGSVHIGIEASMKRWHEWRDMWGEMTLEVTELIPAGDEVVAVLQLEVLGATSGAGLTSEVAQVTRIADGKVNRQRVFLTRAEALEAVGLEE